jgi:hypothetical protein
VKKAENWKLVEDAKIVYSAGFFMTSSPESMTLVSEQCAKSNTIYCLVTIASVFSPLLSPQVCQCMGRAVLRIQF